MELPVPFSPLIPLRILDFFSSSQEVIFTFELYLKIVSAVLGVGQMTLRLFTSIAVQY